MMSPEMITVHFKQLDVALHQGEPWGVGRGGACPLTQLHSPQTRIHSPQTDFGVQQLLELQNLQMSAHGGLSRIEICPTNRLDGVI